MECFLFSLLRVVWFVHMNILTKATTVFPVTDVAEVKAIVVSIRKIISFGMIRPILSVSWRFFIRSCLFFIIVQKSIQLFKDKQDKATTFGLAIKNLVVYHGAQIVLYSLGILFG